MRTIKFRGKRVDNGEWVYGDLVHTTRVLNGIKTHHVSIGIDLDLYEVHPETVGQFTGLHDKDGNEIYEGDMVQHYAWDYSFEVIFNQEKARFVCKMKTGLTQYIDNERSKVLGNIHDNPELIKEDNL